MYSPHVRYLGILPWRVPVPFTFYKSGGALTFELSQVLQVGDAVVRFEELERLAGWKIITLPATVELLLSRTIPDFTMGRAAIAPAGFVASHLYHRA
jgi:hypothetical protein